MRLCIVILVFLGYLHAHVVTPEVFAVMQKRLQKNPQDVEAIIISSHYHENKGEYPQAIRYIQSALDIMKQPPSATPDLYIRMAQMHVNNEEYAAALVVFNKLLTKEFCQTYGHIPPILHAILWRGKVYAALGQNEHAWEDVQFVLEREQEMPAFFVEGAKVAEKLGKNLKAFELYSKVATQFPSPESEPSVVRAIRLVIKEQPQQAAQLLQQLEKLMPDQPYPSFYLAVIGKKYLKDEALYSKKLQHVNEIAQKMSDKSLQFFWLARVLYQQEKYTQALECVQKSIAADERPAAIYELAAAIHEQQGNNDAAQKSKEQCLEKQKLSTYQWLFFYQIDQGFVMRNTIIFVLFLISGLIYGYFYLTPQVVQKIIVVRHAEAYKNLSAIPENAEADSLTKKGEEQAKSLGELLRDYRIDLWISSTKKRAIQTRDIAYSQNIHGGKKETSAAFLSMEKGGKSWEWRTENWQKGRDPRPENGESLSDATQRCLQKLAEYSTAKTIIIFSHGDICATLIGEAQHTPMHQRYQKHALSLAGYAEINVLSNGQWYIR